ncbi:MAG: cell division protein FtsZ [Candidatus Cloacimonadaceae bacterium]
MLEFEDKPTQIGTNIKIVGVGGAGGNAVNTMIRNELAGVEFIAANTDISDLNKSLASIKLQIGKQLTRGLGTGADPEKGSRSAEESKDEIQSHLEGADMVFIAAGMGGGTGTGGAPIVAKMAKDMGILTLGIVTTPFPFEGRMRMKNAEKGLNNLKENVDTLIVIPNEKLIEIYRDLTVLNAFQKADNILYEAAKAVSDIINFSGLIALDFADVRATMQDKGLALMGTGSATGQDKAIIAAKAAISNPLLTDTNLRGCESLLVNITAGSDLGMSEFEAVNSVIVNETGLDTEIFSGVIIDESYEDKITVTIIATGLQSEGNKDAFVFPQIQPPVKEPAPKAEEPAPQPTPKEDIVAQSNHEEEQELIEDIFRRLNFNKELNSQEDNTPQEETLKPLTPRTDLPSFLKALD